MGSSHPVVALNKFGRPEGLEAGGVESKGFVGRAAAIRDQGCGFDWKDRIVGERSFVVVDDSSGRVKTLLMDEGVDVGGADRWFGRKRLVGGDLKDVAVGLP